MPLVWIEQSAIEFQGLKPQGDCAHSTQVNALELQIGVARVPHIADSCEEIKDIL